MKKKAAVKKAAVKKAVVKKTVAKLITENKAPKKVDHIGKGEVTTILESHGEHRFSVTLFRMPVRSSRVYKTAAKAQTAGENYVAKIKVAVG